MGPPPDLFAELSRWKAKAIQRGKVTHFNSDIIPDWLNAEVVAAQEAVGVEGAFSFLKQTPLDVRMAAERRIKRKVQAILKERQAQAARAIEQGEQFDYEGLAEELRAAVLPELSALVVDNALRLSVEVGIGFDPAIINTEALRWAREYSYDLVRGLTDTTRRQLQEAVTSFVQTPGMTIGDIESLIEPAFGSVRAEMIAVTETTRAYSMATNEMQGLLQREMPELAVTRIWNTQNDALVCPECGPLEGAPESQWSGQYPSGPPAHVNCILPGNVVSVPGLVAGAQSLYVGGAVEISTTGGRILTVTENHPILTPRGWVAAGLFSEGDDVVICTAPEWIASSIYPDNQHMPAAIEKVFGALEVSEAMFRSRVPVTAEDFYGDGRGVYGYVNVIGPNRFLLGDIKARLAEPLRETSFSGDGTNEALFVGDSALAFLGPGDISAARGRMGGDDLIAAALGRHAGPFQRLGFGSGSVMNGGIAEDAPDRTTVDTKLASQFVLRFASLIATDKVRLVRKFDFSGHVYDLQSGIYGLYTCNGVLVKNCRCESGISFLTPEQVAAEFAERQAEREAWLREQGLL